MKNRYFAKAERVYRNNNSKGDSFKAFDDSRYGEETFLSHSAPPDDSFEKMLAKSNVLAEDAIELLDCQKLFVLLERTYPETSTEIMAKLVEFHFAIEKNTGKYDITNLGAILLGRRLEEFDSLKEKAVRVRDFTETATALAKKEQIGVKGYAVGFDGLIYYVMQRIPVAKNATGKEEDVIRWHFTEIIEEIILNAFINQDFTQQGSPVISIFPKYIEVMTPGRPFIDSKRLWDSEPCLRNPLSAYALREMGLFNKYGKGYEKVISLSETLNLPIPAISEDGNNTKVIISLKKGFKEFSHKEKIEACYAHVSLNYINGKIANNSSLRKRFELQEYEKDKVSRVYHDACEMGLIKIKNGTGIKNRAYIPVWATD